MEEVTRIIMKREIISDESKKKERERERKEGERARGLASTCGRATEARSVCMCGNPWYGSSSMVPRRLYYSGTRMRARTRAYPSRLTGLPRHRKAAFTREIDFRAGTVIRPFLAEESHYHG